MASMKCQRPADQTNHQPMPSDICQKPINEACHKGNNEHNFSNKVKELANSVTKVFTEHKLHGHQAKQRHNKCHNANHMPVQQPACYGSGVHDHAGITHHEKKKEEHCIPGMGGHKKKGKDMKKKKKKADKSSSSSSSESDNEACDKRKD